MKLIPKRRQWNRWSLPSKLTAIGTLLAAVTFLLYVAEKTFGFLGRLPTTAEQPNIPDLQVLFKNSGETDVEVNTRGEVILWFPQGIQSGISSVTGVIELRRDPPADHDEWTLTIPASDSIRARAAFRNPLRLEPVLAGGETHLSLKLRRVDGRALISEGVVPFERRTLQNYFMRMEVSREW